MDDASLLFLLSHDHVALVSVEGARGFRLNFSPD